MSCKNKLDWRSDIITMYNEYKPDLPSWMETFINEDADSSMSCGSFKAVYVFGDTAISVEKELEDEDARETMQIKNDIIKLRLDKIDSKYKKHFNYSKNEWPWRGYIFRELNLCPEGTLADLMDLYEYNLRDVQLKQLIRALQELHEVAELVIGDLKPQNIMYCKCDCLSFIDLDSVVILPIHRESRIVKTPWWNIISFINPKKSKHPKEVLIASDWVAISLVVLMHYAFQNDGTQLYNHVIHSHNNDNFTYSDIKHIDMDEIKSFPDLAKAAFDVINSFRIFNSGGGVDYRLPERKYIDKLLEVSKSWWLVRKIYKALRF